MIAGPICGMIGDAIWQGLEILETTTNPTLSGWTTNTYSGDGMKRSESLDGVVTTLVWDGFDYLQERS